MSIEIRAGAPGTGLAPGREPGPRVALCVDLDGTLLRGDLLHEGLARLLTANPFRAPQVLGWALRGRRALKERVAAAADLDVAVLPYRDEVIELARLARAAGRRVLLVTAAAAPIATRVAEHLELFDEVVASDDAHGNLAGTRKARYLVDRFGRGGFEYIGDSGRDLPIWADAASGVAVGASPAVRRRLDAAGTPMRHVADRPPGVRVWARQLRLHQATKNLLVLLPLLLAHEYAVWDSVWRALVMVAAFSLLSSGTYVLNDLHDLDADRRHPSKRLRPLASGGIPVSVAAVTSAALVLGGLGAALVLGPPALLVLLAYLVLTLGYSLVLRRLIVADVIALAALYTLRILAGAVAIGVAVSIWVALTSVFLFFSLALMKRVAEFANHAEASVDGRGYQRRDRTAVLAAGLSSGMVAVLVVAMYIDSDEARAAYTTPVILWMLIPLVLFWLTRMWLLTDRGQMHDDPVAYAISDRVSQGVALTAVAIVVAASLVGR